MQGLENIFQKKNQWKCEGSIINGGGGGPGFKSEKILELC